MEYCCEDFKKYFGFGVLQFDPVARGYLLADSCWATMHGYSEVVEFEYYQVPFQYCPWCSSVLPGDLSLYSQSHNRDRY